MTETERALEFPFHACKTEAGVTEMIDESFVVQSRLAENIEKDLELKSMHLTQHAAVLEEAMSRGDVDDPLYKEQLNRVIARITTLEDERKQHNEAMKSAVMSPWTNLEENSKHLSKHDEILMEIVKLESKKTLEMTSLKRPSFKESELFASTSDRSCKNLHKYDAMSINELIDQTTRLDWKLDAVQKVVKRYYSSKK